MPIYQQIKESLPNARDRGEFLQQILECASQEPGGSSLVLQQDPANSTALKVAPLWFPHLC
jgi:hypothetical protein